MTGAVLLFKSLGAGFQALHLTGAMKGLEALELIPLGSQSQLLLKAEPGAFEPFLQQLSFSDLEHVTVIRDWDNRVEKAFYSLEHAKVRGSLFFVEGPRLGVLFEIAHEALRSGLHIVDFKIPRGSVKWGLLTLTGTVAGSDLLEKARVRGCTVTRVAEPSEALKDYFDLEAEL